MAWMIYTLTPLIRLRSAQMHRHRARIRLLWPKNVGILSSVAALANRLSHAMGQWVLFLMIPTLIQSALKKNRFDAYLLGMLLGLADPC